MAAVILPNTAQCRICLKSGQKLLSLYRSDDDEDSPCSMLTKLTGIQFEDEHLLTELPKKICKNCNCELNLSYQFLEKVLQSQLQIENYLATRESSEQAKNETPSKKNIDDRESKATHVFKFEHCNESLVEEDVEFLEEECSPLLESAVETLPNNDFDHENDLFKEKPKCGSDHEAKKGNNKNLSGRENLTDVAEEPLSLEKKVVLKQLSKRGRKPKIGNDRKFHVCEICGNVFSKRGRLTEHLRRHVTEAKYACEICDERFLLREALRRHMFQHLGGKPFKCNFCSRTFFYESVKKAHEAIHAGHKPYVCEKCNKAFAYPHALKKHKLIHDDIKLFSCKYCRKDFRLQHHLKQHEETKAHINTVQTANMK